MDLNNNFLDNILTDEMITQGFPLVYKGQLNQNITKLFTSMAEQKLARSNKELTVRKKVFHVMVECLQNINRHSDDFDDEKEKIGNGLFMIGERASSYYVFTGNVILASKIEKLRNRLKRLNALSIDELNALYKKQIKFGYLTERGGAGLGLIDIVRKTGNPLEYNFAYMDSVHAYFTLKVKITH